MKNPMEKKRKPMDIRTLSIIWELTQGGINATKISGLLDRAVRNVQQYVRVLKAVHNGEPINLGDYRVNSDLVKEYCQKNSLVDPIISDSCKNQDKEPEKAEQTQMDLSTPEAENLRKAVNMLNEIGIAFHSLAEFLWENFCK